MAWPFLLTCADNSIHGGEFTSASMDTISNCGFNLNISGYTPENFNTSTLKQKNLVVQNAIATYYKDSTISYKAMQMPKFTDLTTATAVCKLSSTDVQNIDSFEPQCEFHSDSNCTVEEAQPQGYFTIWGSKGIPAADETAIDKSTLIKIDTAYQDLAFKMIIAGDSETQALPLVK